VTGLNEFPDVGVHESDLHSDIHAVREHGIEICPPSLDEAEDVVPSSTVETARVLSQLKQNLLHLEGGGESLDQHGSTDSPLGHADVALGEGEDVIPEASLQVVLHLGEVKVWTGSSLNKLTGVVEEVEGEVENRAGNWSIVDGHPRLVEMPSSGAKRQSPGYILRARMAEGGHTGQSKLQVFRRVCTACRQSRSRPGDELHRTS